MYLASSNSGNDLSVSYWKNVGGFVEIKKPFHITTKTKEGRLLMLSLCYSGSFNSNEKTTAYTQKKRAHNRFGIVFARNILASIEDKCGRYPAFMLMQPHCNALQLHFDFCCCISGHAMYPYLDTMLKLPFKGQE